MDIQLNNPIATTTREAPGCSGCLKAEIFEPIKALRVPIFCIFCVLGWLIAGYWFSGPLVCAFRAEKECGPLDVGIYVFGTVIIPLAMIVAVAFLVLVVYGIYYQIVKWRSRYFTVPESPA